MRIAEKEFNKLVEIFPEMKNPTGEQLLALDDFVQAVWEAGFDSALSQKPGPKIKRMK